MENRKISKLLVIGAVLSLVAAALYAVLYGSGNTMMNSMSWPAFYLMLGGSVAAVALMLVKLPRVGVWALAVSDLVAFCLSVYAFYPYISAAFVGIDSTWDAPFFIVMGLLVASMAANAVFAAKAIPGSLKAPKVLSAVMAVLYGVMMVGGVIANENAAQISGFLGTPTFREVAVENQEEIDTEYFKSDYENLEQLIAAGQAAAEKAMAEGIVLLKNDNNALPLASGSKLSLFSISSVDPVYGGTGSGHVDTSTAPTWKTALERNGNFQINGALWDWYGAEAQNVYRRTTGSTGLGVIGAKSIGDAPWSAVEAANGSTFAQYGDAALVFISRLGGEGSDMPRGTEALSQLNDVDGSAGDSVDGDYLKLSPVEQDLLRGLKAAKDAGTIKKIVVVLNFANQVETAFLEDAQFGVDAALWIGTPGQVGMYAVSDVLAGKVNPSGRLSATFWKDHSKNPTLANFGADPYVGATDTINADGSLNQDRHYVVYQEGIYLGYKYTESRYEDFVMGTPNTGSYTYTDVVSYPFGHGLSYTAFEYSDMKVEKTGEGAAACYEVTVTVTNTGSTAGKEVVQVYAQKPYGNYNKQNLVEAASVELVGFAKTGILEPGASQTLTVQVKEQSLTSYDANAARTYVLTPGDYYLTAAKNAHDAVNNILAKKGFSPAGTDGRMDAAGNAALVCDAITMELDAQTYSVSAATGNLITNIFDFADWNKYENKGDSTVTYTTRQNWEGTTPKDWSDGVKLNWNDQILVDMNKYGRQGDMAMPEVDMEYPTFGETKERALSLIELRADSEGNPIPYDDPMWDELLDQLTWEDMLEVVRMGMRRSGQIDSINKPECLDHNGPSGLTEPYDASPRGLATLTDDPLKEAKAMCYPCGGILSGSFNVDLMYEVGDLIGEDALWAGYNGLYGPGSNIQRTPYSGRNFEYYSEDGFLSGMICAYECAGMESHGLYVYNKHIGLNDQEDLRRGTCTWANEQTIREIYMRAFELPITIEGTEYTTYEGENVVLDGASGVMLAFNRMGLYWAGMQKGLCTDFLRTECGMTGIIVTDMWYGTATPYMNLAAMLVAGANLIDGGVTVKEFPDAMNGTGHGDVAWGLRESIHRILYTVVHSNAMNGMSSGTVIERITPWWQTAVLVLQITFGVATVASMGWAGFVWFDDKKKAKAQ